MNLFFSLSYKLRIVLMVFHKSLNLFLSVCSSVCKQYSKIFHLYSIILIFFYYNTLFVFYSYYFRIFIVFKLNICDCIFYPVWFFYLFCFSSTCFILLFVMISSIHACFFVSIVLFVFDLVFTLPIITSAVLL